MHKIILPIDTKSLYYNILNDNLKGHTCTVATPIKQGKTLNRYLKEVYKIPKQIDFELHDSLLRDLIKNSKSVVKINNVFVFNKLKVNGEIINVDASYCFYVKEEIDEKKAQFGRTETQKVISIKVREARGIEICDMCGAEIQDGEGFIGTDGSTICEECGDEYLDIHDWTQHDEYPYIDGEGTWDGSMYEGEQFKRR